jgi:uncharacterized membrane protein YhaH (DUF805 family)
MRFLRFCFSFYGRFNRANFWAAYGLAFVMIMVPIFAIYTGVSSEVSMAIGLWSLLWLVSTFAGMTKRLHDLDYSGLLLIAAFAVLVGISMAMRPQDRQYEGLIPGIGLIWLGSMRGVKGANRFGPDPSSPAVDSRV